ncbi:glycosyltransferase family 39 protein [Anabaena catenula]|uniref:Glycosyltransferase family 39 protein n=1 Tax=Anabaena catenula FACHB-362 TaxID=2692877 RepID=A0ABR8J5K0_9NOST|nr:glycosyltransferase family 39 protein [Anabaena catenula]MBD2692938.1 glycosyltransferase family 39 protein [Anabaena catenula FACHB-362]
MSINTIPKFLISNRDSLNIFKILCIALLIIGVFFRFANLDKKVYWGDETSTSSRIAGYTFQEIREKFSGSYSLGIEDIKQYQQLTSERTWVDVVKGLAAEEPQLPPVYFLSLRWWAQLFGTSVTAIRSFSALISLLAFPCIYWLCRELFESSTPAWTAVALIAISPFHLAYAQEARPQSLWIVTILLSSAALLRAIRVNTRWSWGIYTATLVLSLYTYMFSALVAIGHGIYVFLNGGFRFSKTVRAYLIAAVMGGLITVPWVIATVSSFTKLDQGTSWVKIKVPLGDLVRTWLLSVNRLFMDFNYNFTYRNSFFYFGITITTVLVGYAIYFLCRHTPKRTWSFILLLIIITALALVLPDLIGGGRRSGVARYLIPSFLGIQLAVAYLLASNLSLPAQKLWHRQLWNSLTLSLISVSIVSCFIFSQSRIWWNKYNSVPLPAIADVINQSPHPIFIGSLPWEFIDLIKTDIKMQSPQNPIPEEASDVFVMSRNYSDLILQNVLEQKPDYMVNKTKVWKDKVDPTYEFKIMLWNLVRKGTK